MPVYSVDKLIAETRRLAAEFRRATGQMLPVSGEIARHDVARLLDLSLCDDRSHGVDAIGRGEREGLRVQIKGRVILQEGKPGQRLGQFSPEGEWDRVVLSLMDADFEPFEIYEADRGSVVEALEASEGSRRSSRGAMSVARFKNIAELVWTRERGLESDVWENHP